MPNPNLPIRPLLGGLATSPKDRALEKHLRSLETATSVELAHIQAAEVLTIAKMSALGTAAQVGFAVGAKMAAARRAYIEADPTAIDILQCVAAPAAHALGNQIEVLNRRLG